jgi:hypothetical protein
MDMKKIVLAGLVLASFGFGAAQAQTNPALQGFNVTATISSKCVTTHTSTPALAFGAVDAFAAKTTSVDITFKCTRNFAGPASVSLSNPGGIVAGLAYTMSVGQTPAKTDGADATTADAATADSYKYTISGAIAAGQAGDTGAVVTDAQTLTILY